MTTTEAVRDTVEGAGGELGHYRPARPDRGPGRWLRLFAGVKEDVLDWVPEERARYTRLGGIILNTGLLAALSLLTALVNVVDVPRVALLPIVVLWGLVIVTFDGWLIASTHGVKGARLRLFLPRLLISILMGAVIAEPLLMWVFRPAIEKEVKESRIVAVAQYESKLKNCNPPSGQQLTTPQCIGYQLNVPSPAALRVKQTELITLRDQLQRRVDAINQVLRNKEATARAECAGTPGPGLTGEVGEGQACLNDRAEVKQYRKDSRLATFQADLLKINNQLPQVTTQLADSLRTYADRVATAIAKKVAEFRDAAQDEIGLLEEGAALGRLASRSTFVVFAEWLVRLLLIVVDSLPVLAKIMSRTTTYDVLVSRQLEASQRLHDKRLDLKEREETVPADIALYQLEHQLRSGQEEVDHADRAARARHEAELDAQIDELATRLRMRAG